MAIVFPGQGSQYAGMGKELLDTYSGSKLIFKEANEILGYDLLKDCLSASDNTLLQSRYLQAGVFVVSYAYFKAFEHEFGITPGCASGHSLGEITALACSGGLNFEAALRLVAVRGKVMSEVSSQVNGGMTAISGIDSFRVESLCSEWRQLGEDIYCANFNLPEQTVIAGSHPSLQKAEREMNGLGAKTRQLAVIGPFHSPMMAAASATFGAYLNDVPFDHTHWPVFSAGTAFPYIAPWAVKPLLAGQLTGPVYWYRTVESMVNYSTRIFVELGPGHILKNLISRQYPQCKTYTMEEAKDRKNLHDHLKQKHIPAGHICKPPIVTVISEMLRMVVSEKHRGLNGDAYERTVAKPFKELQQLQQELEDGNVLCPEKYAAAYDTFAGILEAKQVPFATRANMLRRIQHYSGNIFN